MILCAAAHDLCGDGIALCSGTAEHNRYLSFVACDGVAASAYAKFVLGNFSTQEWKTVSTFQQAIVQTWWCKLRPCSSADSWPRQCARYVCRIQNNGKLNSAASGRRATRGGEWECIVGSTHSRLLSFLLILIQVRGAFLPRLSLMEPSDNRT